MTSAEVETVPSCTLSLAALGDRSALKAFAVAWFMGDTLARHT